MKTLLKHIALAGILFPSLALATSSFNEVWNLISAPPKIIKDTQEQEIASLYTADSYPSYEVSLSRMLEFSFTGVTDLLAKAVHRTLNEDADYYLVLNKLLHSNGICFQGTWKIDQASEYTGLFSKATQVDLIARASVTLSGTTRSEKRGYGMALKLFPSPSRSEILETKNFFLIDVLAGIVSDYFVDASMTNEPEIGISFDLPLLTHVLKNFALSDINPGFRPVTHLSQVSGLGEKITNENSPRWIQLKPLKTNPHLLRDDFRDELKDAASSAPLKYDILVSDQSSSKKSTAWKKLGQVTLTKPTISYGCDRQLHFPHPRILGN